MQLRISDTVIWEETRDGISLYHTETGAFLTLNETGAKIWTLIDKLGERAAVVWQMALQYAGTNATMSRHIRGEVDAFITSVVGSGLVTEGVPA